VQESSHRLNLMMLGSDTIGKILTFVDSYIHRRIIRRTCKSLRKQSEGILERFVSLRYAAQRETLTLSNSKTFTIAHTEDMFPLIRYLSSKSLQIEPCCPKHSFSCLMEAMIWIYHRRDFAWLRAFNHSAGLLEF
jgi:hypothetical protein